MTNGRTDQAPAGRRLGAWAIDFAVILAVAAGLGSMTHFRVADHLSSWPDLAQAGVWEVLQSDGDWAGAGRSVGADVVGEVLGLITQAFVALIVVVFAYQFAGLLWKGATLGKALLDLRVVPNGQAPDRLSPRRAATRALTTTMTDVGLYALACMALLAGRFVLSFVLWVAAVVVLIVNAAPISGTGRSLVDRIAGTAVVPAGRFRRTWEVAREHATVERGIADTRVGLAQVQGTAGAAAQRASQAAKHVLDSEHGRRAVGEAKRVGAGLKGVYDRRRAARGDR